jgi:dipeptidyl peptidase IV (DPP IV)-like protein
VVVDKLQFVGHRGETVKPRSLKAALLSVFLLPALAHAQGTLADYDRANGLRKTFQDAAVNIPERANWIEKTTRFWYRRSVKGGNEVILVDAETKIKKPAFDNERLATSLSAAAGEKFTAVTLPVDALTFVDNGQAVQLVVGEVRWKCELSDYACKKDGPAFPGSGRQTLLGRTMQPLGQSPGSAQQAQPEDQPKISPDGKWEAFIRNYNVFVRPKSEAETERDGFALSFDGSEGNYYALYSLNWSPDSKKLAAYRVQQGYHRKIDYVQSSPNDQLQPRVEESKAEAN